MKTWSCPKKIQARAETILSLPKPVNQYWSMAGLCTGEGCEVDQLLSNNFIKPHQFHGVERVQSIYEQNVAAYPNLNWHHGDFFQAMRQYPDFNPSLVNADLMTSVDTSADFVARLIGLLTPFDAMLIVNFVMEHRGYKTTVNHVLDRLTECQQFRHAIRQGWDHNGHCYLYPGTGKRHTLMGTFIFQSA